MLISILLLYKCQIPGMNIDEAIKRLKGVPCGMRGTSCPDQLAIALQEAKNSKKKLVLNM